ncbi:hypothetical protein [Luteolibacter soli]|uniref:PEP-CTERM protein-sorting domain-containing protein n=1 Tax=Luteolibacter soli TaxID=3135280 RepID=A0ABU9AUW6_9BACT
MKPLPFLAGTTLAWLSGPAMAAVVNFDFNLRLPGDDNSNVATDTYEGLGAAPDSASNTHWNSVRRTSSTNVSSASGINSPILDSAGLSTTVDVHITTTLGLAGIGHERSVGMQELGTAGAYTNLMGDFIQLDAAGVDTGAVATANGLFDGLIIGAVYDIYFYCQGELYGAGGNINSGQNGLFAITDSAGTVTGTPEQTGWSPSNGVFTEGVEYVKLTATADNSGRIFFIWQNVVAGVNVATDFAPDATGGSTDYSALNGIQIVQVVPEASSALLGMLGLTGLLARRRR